MKINIQNLENDLVEMEAEIDSSFLDHEIKQYYPDLVKVHIELDKFGKDYRVDIDLETIAHYVCDRCLDEFEKKFQARQRQIFHVGEDKVQDQEEIIFLPLNTTEIDLSPILSEMILLNHPLKMICAEYCQGICPKCGTDLNKYRCKCHLETNDPRWDELRKLIK